MDKLREYLENDYEDMTVNAVCRNALPLLKDVDDIHKQANSILAETCVQCEEEVTALKDKIKEWKRRLENEICPCDDSACFKMTDEINRQMAEVIQ